MFEKIYIFFSFPPSPLDLHIVFSNLLVAYKPQTYSTLLGMLEVMFALMALSEVWLVWLLSQLKEISATTRMGFVILLPYCAFLWGGSGHSSTSFSHLLL